MNPKPNRERFRSRRRSRANLRPVTLAIRRWKQNRDASDGHQRRISRMLRPDLEQQPQVIFEKKTFDGETDRRTRLTIGEGALWQVIYYERMRLSPHIKILQCKSYQKKIWTRWRWQEAYRARNFLSEFQYEANLAVPATVAPILPGNRPWDFGRNSWDRFWASRRLATYLSIKHVAYLLLTQSAPPYYHG